MSNSNDAKTILSVFISFFFALKARFQVLKFEFCPFRVELTKDKLTISWQKFAQVRLQLEFSFKIRLYVLRATRTASTQSRQTNDDKK